jgi:N-acetylneuraminic acid mutarotase
MHWTEHVPEVDEGYPVVRFGHSMTLLNEAEILMVGGMNENKIFSDVWTLALGVYRHFP